MPPSCASRDLRPDQARIPHRTALEHCTVRTGRRHSTDRTAPRGRGEGRSTGLDGVEDAHDALGYGVPPYRTLPYLLLHLGRGRRGGPPVDRRLCVVIALHRHIASYLNTVPIHIHPYR